MMSFTIQPFDEKYAPAVTELWRDAMKKALGIPPVHTFESQQYFLTQILPQSHTVVVALEAGTDRVLGFMASNSEEISQLYLHVESQRQGIGSALVTLAKEQSNGSLTLHTFEVNKPARAFYEKHGFTGTVGSTDNEEGLLDWVYKWTA